MNTTLLQSKPHKNHPFVVLTDSAELLAEFERHQAHVTTTPTEAPYQPDDIVYIKSISGLDGKFIPPEYINKPMKVLSCFLAPVDDAVLWELELEDFNFMIFADEVATEKPF
jgi:hypothetical protein